jgi:peroxiredoxin
MRPLLLAAVVAIAAGVAVADDMPPAPRVGDVAPDFKLPYATRDSVAEDSLSLSALVAGKKNVVIAFYPADWSGGCTKEVCALRDNFTALGGLNADVVGVSGDYQFSHFEWAKFHNLPFKLASDHRHTVARAYGSYNDAYGFNKRTVFVVNHSGKIAYEDLKYSPRDSVSFMKLQGALKQLASAQP